MTADAAADGLLYLLRANPTLLPVAPDDARVEHMEHRRHDEVHTCLRCGKRANCAYVADTHLGPRWLDLCIGCSSWLKRNATPDTTYP